MVRGKVKWEVEVGLGQWRAEREKKLNKTKGKSNRVRGNTSGSNGDTD